jgi:hypothetical protein
VTVKLDAASTVFPAAIGVYNVERVLVLRKTSLFGTEVLADEGPSATGQTDFTLTFTSAHLLDASDLFVFVVTTVLPFSHPQLEVAQVVSSAPSPILFTFAHGLDGWSKGVIGPEGSNPWGLVDNVHEGNGEAHLDGRGSGSGGKAWIDHSFTLPETVTTLTFDLSAEVIAGSSSSARVVVEFGGVSQNFNFAISNGTNHLSYKRETIDLRQWAGERVKIFVEQNYNGLGGFDKEIYVDNIRISTS